MKFIEHPAKKKRTFDEALIAMGMKEGTNDLFIGHSPPVLIGATTA